VGMQDFESCQSIEKLLIDNEIVGMVKHFINGIEDHGSPFASDIIEKFYDKNELLSHPTTMKLFRKEQFIVSPIIARMTRNDWEEKGSTSARQRAKETIPKLLNKRPIQPIDESLKNELQKITESHL
ncbi:MAG: trimethylamine methyltransferase family protein, partial [Candidatus Kariarchaeaceae archaeon]